MSLRLRIRRAIEAVLAQDHATQPPSYSLARLALVARKRAYKLLTMTIDIHSQVREPSRGNEHAPR
ncbi:hypothetical protein PCAR4_210187 [Paraburkholderia caribensis]|nr:hypothetical protein PCAR4_210187 [Paraburkholderia caribensis]